MSDVIELFAAHSQPKAVAKVAQVLQKGGVVAYPTDSGYALGCRLGDKNALNRIKRIRDLDDKHNFTLMCQDLAQISAFAKVDNSVFRMLKHTLPGPYTFILRPTQKAPKLMHSKRKTLGVRMCEHPVTQALIAAMGEPFLSATFIVPGAVEPIVYPEDISPAMQGQLDLIVDAGFCGHEPTTVIDCADASPTVLRQGAGPVDFL